MPGGSYFSPEIETLDRGSLDALIDERVRYTIRYAADHSPFYRHWFRENGIDPAKVRVHEDLLDLPIISGKTIRENQPPVTPEFEFKSTDWSNVFSIQETSGTSGTPKGFFLTWEDWKRYAEKYARSFVSQGLIDSGPWRHDDGWVGLPEPVEEKFGKQGMIDLPDLRLTCGHDTIPLLYRSGAQFPADPSRAGRTRALYLSLRSRSR